MNISLQSLENIAVAGAYVSVAGVCLYGAWGLWRERQEAKKAARRIAYYNDYTRSAAFRSYDLIDETQRPAADGNAYRLCGGCGYSLTQADLEDCLGEACPRYDGSQAQVETEAERYPVDIFAPTPQALPLRKINVGYNNVLHTDREYGKTNGRGNTPS